MNNFARVTLQPAYVLHHRPFRDSSLLIEALSPEYGRVGLIAKGVKRKSSPWQGLLQPFRALLISWSGKSDLVTLTACEPAESALQVRGGSLISAFYLNELLLRLLQRNDPHPGLFEIFQQTLGKLHDATQQERALRIFEKRLLQAIGYGLILTQEVDNGRPLLPDKRYAYHLERGPVLEGAHAHELTLHGSSLLSLAAEELQDSLSLLESKRLMRAALAIYLGNKPLQSRKLFMDFQKLTSIETGKRATA